MTGFTDDQKAALGAKLDASIVKKRSQAGRELSYIEGWHAIAEANRIFGYDKWHRETLEMRLLGEPREIEGKWRVGYFAKVKIEVFAGERAIIREGCGYGSGIDRDVGSAHESALKEAETDAMKRALMTFGNPFGLALYDKTQENVEKAEPAPRAATPAPPRPAPTPAPAAAKPFWDRPSYELTGKNITSIQAFAESFCKACEQAPGTDAILKLDEDNKVHMDALRGADAPAYQKTRIAVSAAHSKFPKKAA